MMTRKITPAAETPTSLADAPSPAVAGVKASTNGRRTRPGAALPELSPDAPLFKRGWINGAGPFAGRSIPIGADPSNEPVAAPPLPKHRRTCCFTTGILVICVDDSPGVVTGCRYLRRGRVYRVRHAEPAGEKWVGAPYAIWLEDIRLSLPKDGERAYRSDRFRPISDWRIAALRSRLARIEVLEDA